MRVSSRRLLARLLSIATLTATICLHGSSAQAGDVADLIRKLIDQPSNKTEQTDTELRADISSRKSPRASQTNTIQPLQEVQATSEIVSLPSAEPNSNHVHSLPPVNRAVNSAVNSAVATNSVNAEPISFVGNNHSDLSGATYQHMPAVGIENSFLSSGIRTQNSYVFAGPQPLMAGNQISDVSSHSPYAAQDGSDFRLHFSADATYMNRSGLKDHDFVFDDNGVALGNSDLDIDGVGVRVRMQLRNSAGTGFDLSYTDVSNLDADHVVDGPNVTPLFFGGIPATPVASYDVTYVSDFRDMEFNLWTALPIARPYFSWGVGLRRFQVRETFDVTESAQATPTGFFSYARNDLFGAQLGGELVLPFYKRFTIEAGGRYGIYNNDVFVRTTALQERAFYNDDKITTGGSFDIGMVFHFDYNIKLRAGYRGIIIDQLALAPNQNGTVSFFTNDTDLYYDSPLYGAGYIGLDFVY